MGRLAGILAVAITALVAKTIKARYPDSEIPNWGLWVIGLTFVASATGAIFLAVALPH